MTARERVLSSRLIQKTENNESYARKFGLSCRLISTGKPHNSAKHEPQEEKKN